MKTLSLVLAIGALIMSSGASSAQDQSALQCQIAKSESPGFVDLVGQAWANRAISGTYQFVLEKKGPGGSSSVSQSGDFELVPGRRTNVTVTRIDRAPENRFTARLSFSWAGGRQECVIDQDSLARAPEAGPATASSGGNFAGTVQSGGGNTSIVIQTN